MILGTEDRDSHIQMPCIQKYPILMFFGKETNSDLQKKSSCRNMKPKYEQEAQRP